MTKSDRILTPKYLDWHAKLTGLPSVLMDRIWFSLYKKYKKETGYEPWHSPCPICDGKHGNYGLHGSWYCENGNQFPYDPELAMLHSQDKLEYCLACNTSSNKPKFAIIA